MALNYTKARSDVLFSTGASVVVAASDSADRGAHYRCTGTDDQNTINTALAALPTNGGRVLLLGGTYNLSGSVVINRRQVTFEGEGMGFWSEYVNNLPTASVPEGLGMTKLKATTSTFPLIRLDNTTQATSTGRLNGITVRGLYLYGASKSATASVGILCNDAGRVTDMLLIEDVFCHNVYDGMIIGADSPTIRRCSIQDCGNRGVYLPLASANGASAVYPDVYGNVIADIGGYGIQTEATGSLIHHNRVVRTSGVFLTGTDGSVDHNLVYGGGGINWSPSTAFGSIGNIHGNDVQTTTRETAAAIRVNTGYGSAVISNRVVAATRGMWMTSTDACVAADNIVRSTAAGSYPLFTLDGNSAGTLVHDNRFFQDQNIENAGPGLQVTTAAFNVHDNYVSGWSLTTKLAVTASGTNVKAHDNQVNWYDVNDTFTRSDSSTTLGLSTSGHSYRVLRGTFGIASNTAYMASGSAQHNWAVIDQGRADITMQATVVGSSAANQGFALRMQDASNGYLLAFSDGGAIKLYAMINGSAAQVTSGGTGAVTNDVITATTKGNVVTVSKNGTQVFSVTDNTWLAAGAGSGLWAYDNATAAVRAWDNLTQTAA